MLRELTQNEWAAISGGASTEEIAFYPVIPFDSAIVGFVQRIEWETYSWTENVGMFSTIEHVQHMPIVDIQPIFAPAKVYYY